MNFTMYVNLYVYTVMGIVWTIKAARMQVKLYGQNPWRLTACIVLNFLFWPVALVFAIFKKEG